MYQVRSGYVELQGKRYIIELFSDGHFLIIFPRSNRHLKLREHLNALKKFAKKQNPEWIIKNQSRKAQLALCIN